MSYRVRLESGESFPAGNESLLSAALNAGVMLPSDCRQGACGTCRVRLLEGKVAYAEPPMALTPEDEADGFALACQARAMSDLRIRTESLALPPTERRRATIAGLDRLASDVIHMRLELEQPVDYAPGQHMKLRLADGTTRNFSMASRPNGAAVDFHVRRIPAGRFTDVQLGAMRAGQQIDIELPHGAFIFRRQDYRPVIMAVTGTGFAPVRAMLDALLDDPDCPKIALYRGGRSQADLYLHDELQGWRERLAGLEYIPALSRAGRRCYVQDAICADFDDLSEHAIYLCGSPAMTAAARSALRRKGADTAYVYAEGFSFQFQEETT
jgi:CDP-4-dehydro-6-deoxyglucose reductase